MNKGIDLWLDIKDINTTLIEGLLFQYSDIKKITTRIITEDAYIFTDDEHEFSSVKTLNKLDFKPDIITIVITEKPMDEKTLWVQNKQQCLIVMDEILAQINERVIAKIIYTINVYFILNKELSITSVNALLESNDIDYISFPVEISTFRPFKPTLSLLSYNKIPSDIYLLISHGIRTSASWAEPAMNKLEQKNIKSSVFRYGWVDLIKFCFHFNIIDDYARKVLREINTVVNDHPRKRISISVHSFGTLILTRALELAENLEMRLNIDMVILSGSIIPQSYDWRRFTLPSKNSAVTINRIANICGQKDFFPILSSFCIKGTGASGTYFFSNNGANGVSNIRLENRTHGSILDPDIIENEWIQFLYSKKDKYSTEPIKPSKSVDRINSGLMILKYGLYALIPIMIFYYSAMYFINQP